MGRGTKMLLGLRNFNVSVHIPDTQEEAAVEGAVRVHTVQAKGELALLSGQLDAFNRGLAVTRRTVPIVAQPEGDEVTLAETKQRKQTLLAPLAAVPEARVLDLKRKDPPGTRSGSQGAGEAAAAKERASQDKASQRAKKQRQQDVAEAAAKAPAKGKRKAPGLAKPRGGDKQKVQTGMDLSFLTEEGL